MKSVPPLAVTTKTIEVVSKASIGPLGRVYLQHSELSEIGKNQHFHLDPEFAVPIHMNISGYTTGKADMETLAKLGIK